MDSLSYNHLAPPSVFQKFSALIKHNTLVFMTFCWWLFWGVISLGTHKSLFPAPETVHLIVIFCSGLFIGTVFAPSPRTQAPAFANKFLKILRLQFLFLIVPALLGSIWLFWPAYQFYFVDHRPMIFLRDSFFNYGYENAYWFPSKYLWSGFIMVSGVSLQLLLTWVIPMTLQKRFFCLYALLFLILTDMITKGSRMGLYSLGLMFMIYVVVLRKQGQKLSKKILRWALAFAVVGGLATAGITLVRADTLNGKTAEYHLLGISLFSNVVEKRQGWENSPLELGRMSLGGIDYLFTIVVRLFDPTFSSPIHENSHLEIIPVPLIKLSDQAGMTRANAFYTCLSSPYRDFGGMGVLALGIIVGAALVFLERSYTRTKSTLTLAWLCFIFSNSIMGLFGPTLETPGFWVVLILLFWLSTIRTQLNQVISESGHS